MKASSFPASRMLVLSLVLFGVVIIALLAKIAFQKPETSFSACYAQCVSLEGSSPGIREGCLQQCSPGR